MEVSIGGNTGAGGRLGVLAFGGLMGATAGGAGVIGFVTGADFLRSLPRRDLFFPGFFEIIVGLDTGLGLAGAFALIFAFTGAAFIAGLEFPFFTEFFFAGFFAAFALTTGFDFFTGALAFVFGFALPDFFALTAAEFFLAILIEQSNVLISGLVEK
ncbi:MAG TPA: hypothetical protein VI731_00050 [Bacteroidia bacterium]|nr:hypothetical protein [Bacteroidia bacterium]